LQETLKDLAVEYMNSKVNILFLLLVIIGIFKFNISYSIELDRPVLLFPSNKNEQVKNLIYIKWTSVEMAINYRYQLSKNQLFTNIEQESITKDTFKLITNLNENSEYFWRVRAEAGGDYSEWSEERVFYTVDTARPNKIELVYPSSDLLLKRCNYLVEWERVRNNGYYDIELYDEDMNFLMSDTTSEEYYEINEIERGGVVNFHLRGRNNVGIGEWNKFRFKRADLFERGVDLSSLIFDLKKVVLDDGGSVKFLALKGDLETGEKYLCLYESEMSENPSFKIDVNSTDNKLYLLDEGKLTVALVNGEIVEFYEYDNGFKKVGSIDFGFDVEGMYLFDLDRDLRKEYYVMSGGMNAILYEFDLDGMKYEVEVFSSRVDDIDFLDLNRNNVLEEYILSGNSLEVIEDGVNKRIDLGLVYNKLVVLNYNNDEYKDLLVYSENGISILTKVSGENTDFSQKVINFDKVENLDVRDLDNDGFEEVVYIYKNENGGRWLNVLSLENFEIIYQSEVSNNYFGFGDFNSDGLVDLVLNSQNGGMIFENDGCEDSLKKSAVVDLSYSYLDGSVLLEWVDENEFKWSNNYRVVVEGLNDKGYEKFEFNSIIEQRQINLKSGYYNVYVEILTRGGLYSQKSETIRVKTSDLLAPPPKSWDYDILTGDRTTVILKHENGYKINGRDISNGDAIGIFYRDGGSLKCAGYRIWKEGENQAVAVWGDNNNTDEEKDGFEFGESFIYKQWDALEEEEIIVSAELESGFNVFYPDTTTIIKAFHSLDTNVIKIKKGMWQMVATSVSPVENLIDELIGNKDIVFSDELNNIRLPNIYNEDIAYWDSKTGYYVYSNEDYDLEIIGQRIELNSPLFLESGKTFLLPNISTGEIDIRSSFGVGLDNFLFLKNDDGEILIPELGIYQFDRFEKNKSYLCMLKNDFVLKYSETKEKMKDSDNTTVYSSFNNICNFSETKENSHFLIYVSDSNLSMNVYDRENEINICGTLELGWNIVRLWGDDPLTIDKDGLEEGETLRIELLKNGEVINYEFKSIVSLFGKETLNAINYKSNTVVEIELEIEGTNVLDEERIEGNEIRMKVIDGHLILDRMGIENLKIIDTLGRIVFQKVGILKQKTVNIERLQKGSYLIEFMVNKRKEIRKFIF